jgi:hypothetical protein
MAHSNPNLVPKSTVRSDGVATTVHVNPQKEAVAAASAARAGGVADLAAARGVDHTTLMRVGESREMPALRSYDFDRITVNRDEERSVENVTARAVPVGFRGELDYDDTDARTAFLVSYDGVNGSVTRVESDERRDDWEHYTYKVQLHNPYTDEMYEAEWRTGNALERTPAVNEVLSSLVSDAQSVAFSNGIEDWASEFGYEPNDDFDDFADDLEEDELDDYAANFDRHREYRATYEACVKINEELQEFLGRRYDDYMWGNSDSSTLNVTFTS